MNEESIRRDASRREFLMTCVHSLAGLAIVGTVAPLLDSCSTNSIVGVDSNFQATYDVSALIADSQALVTTSNGGDGFPIIIVRQSSTSYVALSMQCTHEGCQVNPPSGSTINCTCHGAQYDLSGNVLHGPAPKALYKYATTYDASSRKLTVKAA